MENFCLSNSVKIPSTVLGTNYMDYPRLKEVVKAAFQSGCFALDTSPNYASEKLLGRILKELEEELGIKREQYFIQTKLDWNAQIEGRVVESFENSLNVLGLGYIDSYLLHWPYPDFFVKDWKTLENLYESGATKSIGVCNFRFRHWEELFKSDIRILPHINQIEIHPYRVCEELIKFCENYSIVTQAYSPTCSMIEPIVNDDILNQLANKYNVSLVQLILKWHNQRGIIPVSRSTNPLRVVQNFDIENFRISHSDMCLINSLDRDYKYIVESYGCPGF